MANSQFQITDATGDRLNIDIRPDGTTDVAIWMPATGETASVMLSEGEVLQLRDLLNRRFPA